MVTGRDAGDARPDCLRYFFALRPAGGEADRTSALAEAELGPRGLVRPGRLHMTLALTEDVPVASPDLVERLLRAGDAVAAISFALTLGRLVQHRGVAVLEPAEAPAGLHDLQARIAAALAAQGVILRAGWSFTPHVTLAYRKAEPFQRLVAPVVWQPDSIWLIASAVGLNRYDMIRHWPLAIA